MVGVAKLLAIHLLKQKTYDVVDVTGPLHAVLRNNGSERV
jgi:hypothetical protein